ncbi:MAG: transporter substrate-binding domain-containing protein [Bacteroidetes bacterium]|nr:transporter substrate-binding domain-containing protein [Bacteroidota bacterium]
MKSVAAIIFVCFCSICCFSQANDTLYIHYLDHPPFATLEGSSPKGIEVDIINEYLLWQKTVKKTNPILKYIAFTDPELFYASVKNSSHNTIGLGAVTIAPEKSKEIEFTTSYLKNVAFCISNGNATDIKAKTQPEIIKTFGSMTALTVTNTTLNKYVNEIKKSYLPELKLIAEPSGTKILDEIARNILYFGYVDAITFWFYVKNNPTKFVKIQKPLIQTKEEFGFILPKGCNQKILFNEFFTAFKKNKNYHLILEKHLGSYMGQIMAVN